MNKLLLIDKPHLIMAYGYWKAGKADQEAIFQLSFRNNPFKNGYAIACGLGELINYVHKFSFEEHDLAYIADLKDENGNNIFNVQFINYLQQLKFICDIDAMPEGTLVFATEPMLLIKGPLVQCLLLENAIISIMSFATLAASKASRMYFASGCGAIGESCLPYSHSYTIASRAAYIGGGEATANLMANKELDIPLKTFMSHSFVMSFSSELEAFRVFADIMQDQTILLLDTYNVIQGVQNAIAVGTELRRRKHELLAVQLSFGNITKFAKKIRRMLNRAGFKNTKILASGDFDETLIKKLRGQKLPIDAWNIGAMPVTAQELQTFGMNYKLIATNNLEVMTTDLVGKNDMLGIQQVGRFYKKQQLSHDIVYNDEKRLNAFKNIAKYERKDLLVPIFRAGGVVYQAPNLRDIRAFALNEVRQFFKAKVHNFKVINF